MKTYLQQGKKTLVSGNAGGEKKFHPGDSKFIFLVNFPEIFFFFYRFFCFFVFFVFFSLFVCFLKLNINILIHILLCGEVNYKKMFIWLISENKAAFFLLRILKYVLQNRIDINMLFHTVTFHYETPICWYYPYR